MICISYGSIALNELLERLKATQMAEIRIDLLGLTKDEVAAVFRSHPNLIATCRPDTMGIEAQRELLLTAIESGAAYVDMEVEAPSSFKKEMVEGAHAKGCKVIVSYHNYTDTPDKETLQSMMVEMMDDGADILKLATMANSAADAARILSLYENPIKPMVALAMGEAGKVTRVAIPLLGAPFTFAAPEGAATAPGQLTNTEMEIIYNAIGHEE
ncbi:type I 3-dehydroquinate dehydratase [Acetobacteroides hydrogenigenes]|uniref:3-dehydroquinate dehydratase n=1 Tax=Acetobacteroides hydrogenigenes TaxID=979970 RepID=A0A4R2EMX9_9BACT|nr:type I 3-dehydroquinate dehydratase [Acetobacteroides hydrogenigenes]TCN70183.1 3-dehydroquinate dehydratase [Acetobacteroides hydrogenigenes]